MRKNIRMSVLSMFEISVGHLTMDVKWTVDYEILEFAADVNCR